MKKLNKKGFTLIELLAIIVILAIIAVITVPIILNIIDDAREGARKNSVVGYGKAVELNYTKYLYANATSPDSNPYVASDAEDDGSTIEVTIDGVTTINLIVDFSGDQVICAGGGFIDAGKVTLNSCQVNETGTIYDYESGQVEEHIDSTD